jgi:hypothetical protein
MNRKIAPRPPLRAREGFIQQAITPSDQAESQKLAQAEARLKDEASRFLAKRRQNRRHGSA